MLINYQRGRLGLVAVFVLMAITLYMALAFPHSLLHFKQSETTEIKAVIIVGRHGEVAPPREAYFESYGEEPPEEWFQLGGPDQLTSTGKERMYLLGKFLRLRYYQRLLQGNPRRLSVRSENSDKCLESAQALLAGLNPPRDKWLWSTSGQDDQLAKEWQPKAVHTTFEHQDDLLSSQTKCLQMDSLRAAWKNSSRYAHLLSEFRHDLQILRQNTGLEFEDDLEVVANVEEQLRARSAFALQARGSVGVPSWYTSTFAQRLAHIAYVTNGCRFGQASSQRLFAGRLLDTMVKNIFAKIRSDLTAGESLLTTGNNEDEQQQDSTTAALDSNETNDGPRSGPEQLAPAAKREKPKQQQSRSIEPVRSKSKLLPPEEQIKLKLAHQMEPSLFFYMTDKQHLTALMNSLKIYSQQPHYGALLIVELHHDPGNQIHFLRLFTINSHSHNVLPEPVRVNPTACLDSVECSPQQFERNIRHLRLDKQAWQQSCLVDGSGGLTVDDFTTTEEPELELELGTTTTTSKPELDLDLGPTERSDKTTSTTTSIYEISTQSWVSPTSSQRPSLDDGDGPSRVDNLEESLLTGPFSTRPISSGKTTSEANKTLDEQQQEEKLPQESATTIAPTLTEIKTEAPSASAEKARTTQSDITTTPNTLSPQQVSSLADLLEANRNGTSIGAGTTLPTSDETTRALDDLSSSSATPDRLSNELSKEDQETIKVDQSKDIRSHGALE